MFNVRKYQSSHKEELAAVFGDAAAATTKQKLWQKSRISSSAVMLENIILLRWRATFSGGTASGAFRRSSMLMRTLKACR